MKKNLNPKKLLGCALLMLGGMSTVHASTLIVHVNDSKTNAPIALNGVTVELDVDANGTYESTGVTGIPPDGVAAVAGVYPFGIGNGKNYKLRLTYNGTTYVSQQGSINGGGKFDVYFKTSELKVVTTYGGVGVAGNGFQYKCSPSGNWITAAASTDGSGTGSIEVFPSNGMEVRAVAKGSFSGAKSIASFPYGTQCATVSFTDLVELKSPNAYFQMGSLSVNSGYLFPGTYPVWVNNNNKYPSIQTVSGLTFEKVPAVVLVQDHTGLKGIQGAAIRGGYGNIPNGGGFGWHCTPTDVNGVTVEWTTPGNTMLSYEANVNGSTSAKNQDVNTNNVFGFQSSELTLKLQDCAGNGIAGGSARYGIDANYGTWYVPGVNQTDNNGIMSMEAFPGTYSFEMGINQSTEVKQIVFNGTNGLTWTTSKVAINWPYDLAYGGNGGSAWFPNKAGTEMLPGTWNFRLDGPAGQTFVPITVSGCSTAKSPVIFRLINSAGLPIEGGQPEYGVSEWHSMPLTNAAGNSAVLLDGNLGSTYCSMYYKDGRQVTVQDLSASQIVTFQTKLVTIDFQNSDEKNDVNQVGENLQFGISGYQQFGETGKTTNGKATMELLPLSYYFQLSYKGGTQTLVQDVAQNQTVLYRTKLVTIDFQNSDKKNDANQVGENLQFGIYGYQQFGAGATTNGKATMELLPLSYYFQLSYKGGTQTLVQDVAQNQTVPFNTTKVTMKLLGATNATEGTNLQFGIYGYQTFATGSTSSSEASMELLPLSYYFSLNYGASNRVKVQDVSINPVIEFSVNANGSLERKSAGSNSLEAAASIDQVSFYPNPAISSLNISMPAAGTVEIISVDGRKLAQHTVAAGTSAIDVVSIPTGNYLMIINYNGKTETHKFIKN